MKVLVAGGGAREHALAWRLASDPRYRRVLLPPGNPGAAGLGRLVPVDLSNPQAIFDLAVREGIDLTVIGPEGPLGQGVADLFRKGGMPVVGPAAAAAALECSKVFAKDFMARCRIPTANYIVCRDLNAALDAVAGPAFGFPVVVKADGLAGGKGVVIAEDRAQAEAAVRAAMGERQFGAAGDALVIEECLSGPEASFFVLADGAHAVPLGSAQDHKRIWDDDRGPNTGGMGAIAPSPLVTGALADEVMRTVVQPVLDGMQELGGYRGFLYVSLMLTAAGPKVIEFNVRLGDPEAQVVLPLIEGPLAPALLASATGALGGVSIRLGVDRLAGVVAASAGYPGPVADGRMITGLDRAGSHEGVTVFHAGTRATEAGLVTSGGRVLTVVGRGADYGEAIARAYRAIGDIQFEGMQYRRDIGRTAVTLGT